MFASMRVEDETERVKKIVIRLPTGFLLGISDAALCRYYLYNQIMGNIGVFEDVPIIHVHHMDVQPMLEVLLHRTNTSNVGFIYYANRSVFAITDGDFEVGNLWTGGRRRIGPILSDRLLQFHYKRYKNGGWVKNDKETHIVVDVFTASFVPGVIVRPEHNFNFRMIKVYNPDMFRPSSRILREVGCFGTGPYGLPPTPFLGPSS